MKLFRANRFKNFTGKRIGNYLIYALGEIILVVVGILIAVTINNRNENAKVKTATFNTAKLVLNKMKQDTVEIDSVFDTWEVYEKSITIILQTKSDEPVPSDCKNCEDVLFVIELPDISSKVNDLIAREKLASGTIEDEMYRIDELYKEFLYTNKFYVDRITEGIIENVKYLTSNYDWFAAYISNGECNSDCNTYFTMSSDFRNRIAYINQIAYSSYYNHLDETKSKINEHIVILEALIEKE